MAPHDNRIQPTRSALARAPGFIAALPADAGVDGHMHDTRRA